MKLPFDRNINPYFALLVVTVVGSGAVLVILRSVEVVDVITSGPMVPF